MWPFLQPHLLIFRTELASRLAFYFGNRLSLKQYWNHYYSWKSFLLNQNFKLIAIIIIFHHLCCQCWRKNRDQSWDWHRTINSNITNVRFSASCWNVWCVVLNEREKQSLEDLRRDVWSSDKLSSIHVEYVDFWLQRVRKSKENLVLENGW